MVGKCLLYLPTNLCGGEGEACERGAEEETGRQALFSPRIFQLKSLKSAQGQEGVMGPSS
jgi:hypothetical protein